MNKKQMIILAKKYGKQVDWRFFRDEISSRAKEYFYGGIPLDILLLCKNMEESNCFLYSTWLMELYPNATLVEGSCESYRQMKGARRQKPCPGYHVWVELDGKVIDPGALLAMDKEVYYNLQKVKVLRTSDYKKAYSEQEHLKPTKTPCDNRFDKLRQFLIGARLEALIKADNWLYKDIITKRFDEYMKSLDIATVKNCWVQDLGSPTDDMLPDVALAIFKEASCYGPYQQQQRVLAKVISEQFENLPCMKNLNKESKKQSSAVE